MSAIKKRIENLPVKPEDLQRWILVGKVKLKAQIDAIRAISKLDDGIAAHAAALSDTQDLAEELLYAEARMGEMLEVREKQVRSSRGGTSKPLPKEIDKKQSHYAQTLSRNEPVIAKVVAEAREKGEVPVRQHVLNKVKGSLVGAFTANAENYTPKHIVERVKHVMGEIDLDPASCEYAQKIVQAKEYYTKEDSGLNQSWYGNVFLNPPYGMPDIRNFTDKLIDSLPELESAILLTNDQTDTKWWHKCADQTNCICFLKGRISFYTPNETWTSPTNGQTIMYFGDNREKFIMGFIEFGLIMRVIK